MSDRARCWLHRRHPLKTAEAIEAETRGRVSAAAFRKAEQRGGGFSGEALIAAYGPVGSIPEFQGGPVSSLRPERRAARSGVAARPFLHRRGEAPPLHPRRARRATILRAAPILSRGGGIER